MNRWGTRGALRAAVITCCLCAVPTTAATITVTPANFATAVASARGGDTLVFVGTFSNIGISNRAFGAPVTINASRATFTGTFTLDYDDNLTVAGGTFNISGAPQYSKAIVVYGGRNITLSGQRVTGTAGGEGIVFSGTTNATLSGVTFHGLQVAAVIGSVTNGIVTGNTVTGAVSDGIDIANSHGVTASANACTGSTPGPGVHPDCIQLWSVTGQALQSNIVVRNNSVTGATQGFTAFDSMGGELDVQIVHNSVDTSYPQGIACYSCVDSNISYNRVATLPDSVYKTSLNVVGGSRNTVTGNVIQSYRPPPHAAAIVALPFSDADPDDPTVPPAPDLALLVGTPPPSDTAAAVVPEPSTWAMLIAGFATVGIVRRRAVRSARAPA